MDCSVLVGVEGEGLERGEVEGSTSKIGVGSDSVRTFSFHAVAAADARPIDG